MPFGATPVWPWRKPKKPTPVNVAAPRRSVNEEVPAEPQAAMSFVLDVAMPDLAQTGAPAAHEFEGNSAIIVTVRLLPGCAMTRWMSRSASAFIDTRFARTRK